MIRSCSSIFVFDLPLRIASWKDNARSANLILKTTKVMRGCLERSMSLTMCVVLISLLGNLLFLTGTNGRFCGNNFLGHCTSLRVISRHGCVLLMAALVTSKVRRSAIRHLKRMIPIPWASSDGWDGQDYGATWLMATQPVIHDNLTLADYLLFMIVVIVKV